jgi:hypothetical protein
VGFTKSNDSISLQLPESKIEELIVSADNNAVQLDSSGVDGAKSVDIPAEALVEISNSGLALSLELPQGGIKLDNETLQSVLDSADGSNLSITLEKMPDLSRSELNQTQEGTLAIGDTVYDLTVVSNGTEIHEFDGVIEVTVPYEGKLPVKAWFLGEEGKSEKIDGVYDPAAGTFTFKVPHLSLWVVGQDESFSFTDVDSNSAAVSDIRFMVENGLMQGFGDGSFRPDAALTRKQMVMILYRLNGSPSGYESAADWAMQNAVVLGYDDGTFRPDLWITRQQLAAILYRYAVLKGNGPTGSWMNNLPFGDVAEISDYALEGIAWCYENGMIDGTANGNFEPNGTVTRAQVSAILNRFAANGLNAAE